VSGWGLGNNQWDLSGLASRRSGEPPFVSTREEVSEGKQRGKKNFYGTTREKDVIP
jgi:hypothetical protein